MVSTKKSFVQTRMNNLYSMQTKWLVYKNTDLSEWLVNITVVDIYIVGRLYAD